MIKKCKYVFVALSFLLLLLCFRFNVAAAAEWTFPVNTGVHTESYYDTFYEEWYYRTLYLDKPDTFYAYCLDTSSSYHLYEYTLGGSSEPIKSLVRYDFKTSNNDYVNSVISEVLYNPGYNPFSSVLLRFKSVEAMQNYCLYGDESGITWKPKKLEDIMPPLENATYDAAFELKDFFVTRDENWVSINWSGFKLPDVMLMLALNSGDNPYSYVFIEFGYSPTGGTTEPGNTDIVWKSYDKFYRAYSGGCEIALSDIAPEPGYYLSRVRVTPYYYTEPPTMPDNVIDMTRLPFSPFLRVGNRYTVSWSELGNQSGFVRTDNPRDSIDSTDKEGNFFDTFWSKFTSLFIPDESYFQNYYENIEMLFMDHFGGLYQVIRLVIDVFNKMITATNEANPCIHFPGIPWLNGVYLAEPQDIYILDYWSFYSQIRNVCYVVTDVILVGSFLMLLQVKIRRLLSI